MSPKSEHQKLPKISAKNNREHAGFTDDEFAVMKERLQKERRAVRPDSRAGWETGDSVVLAKLAD